VEGKGREGKGGEREEEFMRFMSIANNTRE
jgi:hypothetical protein